jgi:hypothetical protein
LSIVIDKANGDFFKIKRGSLPINWGVLIPLEKNEFNWTIRVKGRSYEMNFNLISRKSDIKSGSYILWTGNQRKPKLISMAVCKKRGGCTY